MKKEYLLLRVLVVLSLLAVSQNAYASSNPGLYKIPTWTKKSEILYQSCGCADSCWTATLRERKTQHVKAILRCDCENLYFIFPINSAEEALGKSCNTINKSSDKFRLISKEIKGIIDSKPLVK